MESPALQTAPKIDPVDVALLVIFQTFLSAFPNMILGFFTFGKVFGFLVGSFAAGVMVGLMRKTKRPPLSLPRERMRLARCATFIFVALAIGTSFLWASPERPFSPPLLGAPAFEGKTLWVVALIGVPVMAVLIFLTTRLGLGIAHIAGRLPAGAPTAAGGAAQGGGAMVAVSPPVFAPLTPLGNVLQVLLGLTVAFDIADLFHSVSNLGIFSQTADVRALLLKMGGGWWGWLSLVHSLVAIAIGVILLFWLHHAYRNLQAWGIKGLGFTPGWAVGWWFIPIMNFFKPYQVVRQLWKASDPEVDRANPESWKQAPGTPWMPLWWVMWLIAIVNLKFTGTAVNPGNLELLNKVSIVSRSAHLIAAILLIFIVRTITQRHEKNASSAGPVV